MRWPVRRAVDADMIPLATLWHATWHEAHAAIVPPALTAMRSLESFATRLAEAQDRLRVAGPDGAPLGLCITKDNRVDQIYIAAVGRGTGLAAALLADGTERLRAAGVIMAELDCAEGNDRAARFYAQQGWQRRGVELATVETADGPFPLRVIVFEKQLLSSGAV
ncbi:MAG: GNAT family N-acetyltransferase [Rhodobacteraceae bacterium]|nr:GNAT family N-acetyltransferase [Paracoccaceae bacterium]